MKKLIVATLAAIVAVSSPLAAAEDDMQQLSTNTDNLYRVGAGAEDGAFTGLSMSMLGWGLGLGTGIAILAALLHQSTSTSH